MCEEVGHWEHVKGRLWWSRGLPWDLMTCFSSRTNQDISQGCEVCEKEFRGRMLGGFKLLQVRWLRRSETKKLWERGYPFMTNQPFKTAIWGVVVANRLRERPHIKPFSKPDSQWKTELFYSHFVLSVYIWQLSGKNSEYDWFNASVPGMQYQVHSHATPKPRHMLYSLDIQCGPWIKSTHIQSVRHEEPRVSPCSNLILYFNKILRMFLLWELSAATAYFLPSRRSVDISGPTASHWEPPSFSLWTHPDDFTRGIPALIHKYVPGLLFLVQ